MEIKFDRVFAPVDNIKFDKIKMEALGRKTVFVCPVAMFDDIKDRSDLFERYVKTALHDYNPDRDVIADFGDSMIFAMMAFYIGIHHGCMWVARYNRRNQAYTLRRVDENNAEWIGEIK
jgi:hypothetical protein